MCLTLRSCAALLLGIALVHVAAADPVSHTRGSRSTYQISNQDHLLDAATTLTITHPSEPFHNADVYLDSDDAMLIIQNLPPSQVRDDWLGHIYINDQPARLGQNVRLTSYAHGTAVLPHGPDFQPLTTYNQARQQGEGRRYDLHTYYRSEQLGDDEDQIQSFVLKRGYMATFAENADGTGVSRVYIADQRDLRVAQLPAGLRGNVSFIRVFPWRWTAKRGYGGSLEDSELLGAYWRYQWNANAQSTLDMEYVPMRHNANWPGWPQINGLENVTHLLGFNEPMQEDQADMTMQQVLNQWPRLQASGLRLGSPCTTDGTVDWLYEFMEEADARGYRVDFVTVHYYKGGWSNEQMTRWLREIHERTGRPLWVTEFNNGARWVRNHNPSMQENARVLNGYCELLDSLDFVERYAVFNMRGNRAVINRETGALTPTGRRYSENTSAEAYNSSR